MLGDRLLAALADVGRRLRLALLPAQPLEREMLRLAAVRARHEVPPLVGGLVFPLDPRQPLDRRRRGEEHLAPPGEGARPRFGQRHRIALVVGRRRIGVDLVEEQVAHRHRAQADGGVRSRHHQDAAGELLRQHGVAGVARARRRHLLAQSRAFLDQRIDALLREALGQLDRRLHRQHRPRRVVDDVADPVAAALAGAQLAAFHEHHPLRRMARAQCIHQLLQVRRPAGPPRPGLVGAARAQDPMAIGPRRDGERRIRREPSAPGAQQVLGAVEGQVH